MRLPAPLILAALAAVLSGCDSKPAGIFAMPLGQAKARLQQADVAGFQSAWQCGIVIDLIEEPADDGVAWQVKSSGKTVASFKVALSAEGGGTRAAIVLPPEKNGGEIYDGQQVYPRPALRQPLRPALEELVNAAMEQRAFDEARVRQGPRDTVCNAQRGSRESGTVWSIDDDIALDSRQTARKREREAEERDEARRRDAENYGKPMTTPRGNF